MDNRRAEDLLNGRPLVAFTQGPAAEIKRLQAACLSAEIAALVGPSPGKG